MFDNKIFMVYVSPTDGTQLLIMEVVLAYDIDECLSMLCQHFSAQYAAGVDDYRRGSYTLNIIQTAGNNGVVTHANQFFRRIALTHLGYETDYPKARDPQISLVEWTDRFRQAVSENITRLDGSPPPDPSEDELMSAWSFGMYAEDYCDMLMTQIKGEW